MTSYERRQVLFLHDREAIRRSSHSPIDNCSLFIRLQEYKSQVTSFKYRLCSHSLEQSRRQYSFFSRSAKPACGFKQLNTLLLGSLNLVPRVFPFSWGAPPTRREKPWERGCGSLWTVCKQNGGPDQTSHLDSTEGCLICCN